MQIKFEDLHISEPILRALNDMGFEEPTPIQREAIPVAKSGQDMIGQAQTGTGKTAAFGIPALEQVDPTIQDPQVLILSPTRELAIQVAEELNKIAQHTNIQALPIYGGQDIGRQFRMLKKHPQVIVATPGRLMDHMERKSISFDHVKVVILDEADEMLNMGFVDDINKILTAVPGERQTLLFSATMPKAIQELAETYLTEPTLIRMKPTQVTMDLIEQYYIEVQDRQKFDVLCRLLDIQAPELAIIFTRTKRRVDEVTEALKKRGYMAEGIHGDLSQQKRMSVLRSFKRGDLDILVATDVAARGLDISGVTHVYNYDIPQDPESYVHRIGRTGRAGKGGMSVTFVTPNEMGYLHVIENLTKKRMNPMRPPTEKEAFKGQLGAAMEQIQNQMEENSDSLEKYNESAKELLAAYSPEELAALLLKTTAKDPADAVPVKITPERPLPSNKKGGFNRGGKRGGGNNRGGGRGKDNYRKDRGGDRDRNKNKNYGGNKSRSNNKNTNRSNDKKRGFVIRTNSND